MTDPGLSKHGAGGAKAQAGLAVPHPARPPGQTQVLHACLIAAVAAAGWMLGVRPLEQRLAARQADLEKAKERLAEFEQGVANAAPLEVEIQSLTAQARQINAWTAASGDASRLYDAFRALAAKSSVRIERVEPSSASRTSVPKPKPGNASEVFGYTIEITGTYAAVAGFMDDCEQDLGVTKIISFHMSPNTNAGIATSADPVITAIIETSHLRCSIPSATGEAPKPDTNLAAESGS